MTLVTTPFDAAPYLRSAEAQAELLTDAFATGEPGYIAAALDTVARARGATLATDRQPDGAIAGDADEPSLSSVLGLMRSFGMTLHVEAEKAS